MFANAKPESPEFTAGERQVAHYLPADLQAPNHNDLRAFMHAWFASFDHAAPAEFFLTYLDDADMTFNMDGQVLAHDHASFRTWYAEALQHIPWDFHDVLGVDITGTSDTGWTAGFFFRHVGEWHDQPLSEESATAPGRPFNRVLRATWRVEHTGQHFLIRRYELTTVQTVLAQ